VPKETETAQGVRCAEGNRKDSQGRKAAKTAHVKRGNRLAVPIFLSAAAVIAVAEASAAEKQKDDPATAVISVQQAGSIAAAVSISIAKAG
jgi:hypothetical protein